MAVMPTSVKENLCIRWQGLMMMLFPNATINRLGEELAKNIAQKQAKTKARR